MLFLDKIFQDNVKARTLESDGEYTMVAESRDKDMCPCEKSFSMQEWCIEHPMQGVKREEPTSWSVRPIDAAEDKYAARSDMAPSDPQKALREGKQTKALEEADIKLLPRSTSLPSPRSPRKGSPARRTRARTSPIRRARKRRSPTRNLARRMKIQPISISRSSRQNRHTALLLMRSPSRI